MLWYGKIRLFIFPSSLSWTIFIRKMDQLMFLYIFALLRYPPSSSRPFSGRYPFLLPGVHKGSVWCRSAESGTMSNKFVLDLFSPCQWLMWCRQVNGLAFLPVVRASDISYFVGRWWFAIFHHQRPGQDGGPRSGFVVQRKWNQHFSSNLLVWTWCTEFQATMETFPDRRATTKSASLLAASCSSTLKATLMAMLMHWILRHRRLRFFSIEHLGNVGSLATVVGSYVCRDL